MIAGRYRTIEGTFGIFDKLVTAGFAGIAVLLVALIGAIVIGRLVAAPLRALADASDRVRMLDLDPPPNVARSRLRELVKEGGEAAAASGERDVTVLFTDIRQFTPRAEGMPAEDVADFLNAHFTKLAECIDMESGTIDKYIGDSVMAFWGAPHAVTDHAERATRATIAMRKAIERENEERRSGGRSIIEIGIGIHSGRVIAGNIGAPGRINYTLIGDTVNTAQRLEQFTKTLSRSDSAIKILISKETAVQLTGRYNVRPFGTHEVRGRYQEVEIFEII